MKKSLFCLTLSFISLAHAELYFTPTRGQTNIDVRVEVVNELNHANALLINVDSNHLSNILHSKDELIYSDEFNVVFDKNCKEMSFTISTSAPVNSEHQIISNKPYTLEYSLWQNGERFAIKKQNLKHSTSYVDFMVCHKWKQE